MGPSGGRLADPNAGAVPDPPRCDRQNLVAAAQRAMVLAGENSGDFVVGNAIAGESEDAVTHFHPSRELSDGGDLHLDLEIAYHDNSFQRRQRLREWAVAYGLNA